MNGTKPPVNMFTPIHNNNNDDNNSSNTKTTTNNNSSNNTMLFNKINEEKMNLPHNNLTTDLTTILSGERLHATRSRLVESVQFNSAFDVDWLVSMYPEVSRTRPLLLVHGNSGVSYLKFCKDIKKHPHIGTVRAALPNPAYCRHNTKLMLLVYEGGGLCVVVHTATLQPSAWEKGRHGIWVSPMFEKKSSNYVESSDVFKRDLVQYVGAYNNEELEKWVEKLKEYDMTSVGGIRLVASVPGRHKGESEMAKWGHVKLRKVLSECGPETKDAVTHDWPIVIQAPNVNLGPYSQQWLFEEFLPSFATTCKQDDENYDKNESCKKEVDFKLIYPTLRNIQTAEDGYAIGSHFYWWTDAHGSKLSAKNYLRQHMCRWTTKGLQSGSMSCSYTRLSPCSNKVPWFLLTSAPLKRGSWGFYEKGGTQVNFSSYELGVLLFPGKNQQQRTRQQTQQQQQPLRGTQQQQQPKYFCVHPRSETCAVDGNTNVLKLPYCLPLEDYNEHDEPWVKNRRYVEKDNLGQHWIPKKKKKVF